MTTTFATPITSVQIAFTNNPYDASLTWVDVSQYAESATVTMGRQHELQQTNPSTATIVFTNQDGRFSPWNTSSPYYHSGNGIAPGHPIRIMATWPRSGGTTYPVFYGYCKAWTPGYGLTQSKMTLTCYDILALLNLNTLDTGQYVSTVQGDGTVGYWQCADAAGSTVFADSSGNNHPVSVVGGVTFGATVGPLLTETLTAASVGYGTMATDILPANGSGYLDFWVEGWVQLSANPVGGFFGTIFATNSTTTPVYLGINTSGQAFFDLDGTILTGLADLTDGTWHHVAAGVSPGFTMFLMVDGQEVGEVIGPNVTFTNFVSTTLGATYSGGVYGDFLAGNIAHVNVATPGLVGLNLASRHYQLGSATWLVQDSGARVETVLNVAGIPSAHYNIPAGTAQCQAATSALTTTTAMSYLNQVVNTERGFLYQDPTGVIQFRNREYVYETSTSTTSQATFGYTSGQYHYFSSGFTPTKDDVDLWNNIPVQRQNGTVQTASNPFSIAAYGRRTLTGYTSLLFSTDEASADLAQALLYQYAGSTSRVRAITMDNTISDGANLPVMLGLQLLNRITINWRPMDGSGVDFTEQALIEQISHSISPGKWSTTFAVTPIGTEGPFFVLGTSQLGTGALGL